MKSVADELRKKMRWEVLAMTPEKRLALAFALGDPCLEIVSGVQIRGWERRMRSVSASAAANSTAALRVQVS